MFFLFALLTTTLATPLHLPPTNTTLPTLTNLRLLLTLTTLEASLYSQACSELDPYAFASAGYNSTIYDTVCEIAIEKTAQVIDIQELLRSLGESAGGAECEYDFVHGSVEGFVSTAREVEVVVVGAVLGVVEDMEDTPDLQTFIASLATMTGVDRRDDFVRDETGLSPSSAVHDIALPPAWAYNLIQKWIRSCPEPLDYPIFPRLNYTTSLKTDDASDLALKVSLSWKPCEFAVEVSPQQPLYLALLGGDSEVRPHILGVQRTTVNGTVHTGEVVISERFATDVAFAALTTFVELNSVDDLVQYGTLAGPVELLWL